MQREKAEAVIVYAVVDDALSPDFPLGDSRCSSGARTPSGSSRTCAAPTRRMPRASVDA